MTPESGRTITTRFPTSWLQEEGEAGAEEPGPHAPPPLDDASPAKDEPPPKSEPEAGVA